MSLELTKSLLTAFIIIFIIYIAAVSTVYFYLVRRPRQKMTGRLYVKALPFHLTELQYRRIRLFTQFIFGALALIVIILITILNLTPFGVQMTYALNDKNKSIPEFGPKERVKTEIKNGKVTYKQIDDLIYFSTPMPFHYDQAKVRITFANTSPDQELQVGYKDRSEWHYLLKVFHAPMLDRLNWSTVGDKETLYQREKNYDSLEGFVNNIPSDEIIGIYNLEDGPLNPYRILPDYRPSKTKTVITTPLRGSHTMYVYLKNEPFHMTFYKQDLNWYKDADTITVTIFKDDFEVMEVISDDDGISDSSKHVLREEKFEVKNPGPDLPESGVYKVVINASTDTVIKRIETNLSKIVFSETLFPAGNKIVYPKIVEETKPVTLYTDALLLSANTYHREAYQDININDKILNINDIQKEFTATLSANTLSEITVPEGDVVLTGVLGYFSFSKDAYFNPIKYLLYPVKDESDIAFVDYILTDYRRPIENDDWKTTEVTFDLDDAYLSNNKLSWIIQAPGIRENKREVIIKDISVEMSKEPHPFIERLWNRF
jgi:hypothetical protein